MPPSDSETAAGAFWLVSPPSLPEVRITNQRFSARVRSGSSGLFFARRSGKIGHQETGPCLRILFGPSRSDIVGFFVADEADDLLVVIDECLDAADCEYMELPNGGIMWTSPAIAVPFKVSDPDDDESESGRVAMGNSGIV